MKKLFIVFALLALVGCNLGEDAVSLAIIKNAARALGYEVGKTAKPELELAIEQDYALVSTGQYNEVALTEALLNLKQIHPLLMASCLDALAVMGATVNGDAVVDMTGISPAAWQAAEVGYRQGLLISQVK